MEKQSTSKLLRLMVAVFALFLLVMTGSVLSACGGNVAHEHKYGSPEHTNPSTCGSTGYDVYTCSECGDKYAVVTAATGKHTFQDGYCTVCGVSSGEDLKSILNQINSKVGTTTPPENAHQHNFSTTVKEDIAPTCLTFGITVMKCDCGSTSVTSLKPATGHKYAAGSETGSVIKSTCTTNGQIEVVCSQCGDTYWEPNPKDMAPGHDFTYRTKEFAEANDQAANCVSPARIAYKCTRCDEIQWVNVGDSRDPDHHVYEKDADGNDVWKKVEGSEKEITSSEEITKDLKTYVKIGTYEVERACTLCGEPQKKEVPADHEHNFIHTTNEFNRLTEVNYTVKNEDGTTTPHKDYLTKENCTADGAENWHCVYEGCEALENEAGKWEKVEETTGEGEAAVTTTKYVYRPSGWNSDPTKCKESEEIDGVKHTYEWRAKLNHTYADKLKDGDGNYTKESEIKYITEIDKENGKVVTHREEGETKNNTSSWWGQTCELCGHEIAFQTKEDENKKKVPDVTKDILVIERDEKGEVKFDGNDKWIVREWHSWVLYTEKTSTEGDTTTPGTGSTGGDPGTPAKKPEKIDPPKTPEGYEKNQAATCTKAGWDWYWCQDSQCKQLPLWVKVILPPLGHDWAIEEFEDPTCEGDGTLTLKCQRDKCTATLELTVENYSEVIGATGWTWNRHTLKTPEWVEPEEGKLPNYDEKYVDLWTLGIESSDDTSGSTAAADAIRKLGKLSWRKEALTEENKTTNTPTEYTLRQALELIIPTGHQWKKLVDVNNGLCYNDKGTSYYCTCTMTGCHAEGGATASAPDNADKVKCTAIWLDVTMTGHLVGEDYSEKNYKTFTLYGFCGTNNHGNVKNNFCHNTYTVTYCPVCYAIIKVEKSGDNFRHFPFDREKLFGHMMASAPVGKHTLQEVMEDPTLLQEEKGNYADYAAEWNKTQREKFVKTWIEIDSYWFEKEGGTIMGRDLIDYVWIRDNELECFDCFNHVGPFNEIEDLVKKFADGDAKDVEWSLLYYVKGTSGEMILIEESNRYTYNPCEYQYYSQYKIWCETEGKQFTWYSTMKDMTLKDWGEVGTDGNPTMDDVLQAIGKYKLETVKADGTEFTPDGKHYLVPAKNYWEHENFKRGGDGIVTMDWVCAFCGSTFELQVKYTAPTATATADATYKENVSLVNKDETKILLVDMNGVKFTDTTLNQRQNSKETIFEIDNRPLYWKDTKDGKTNVGDSMMTYLAQGTILIQVPGNSSDICVGHRESSDTTGGNYFEGTSVIAEVSRIASLLRPEDFVDPTNKEAYTALWNDMFKISGTTQTDEQKTATNKLLDAYFKRGGEIVLGGNVGEPVKTEGDGANKSCGFGTQRTSGEGCVQTDGNNPVNVFVVPADTTIDLNDNTFYGNLFVNTGSIAGVKGGHSVIKNGKIVLEDKGRLQVVGGSTKDVSLELDGVEVTGGGVGVFMGTYGNVTIKNSSIVAEHGRALEANNAETTAKGTTWVLENSAFISKTDTAFFMPGEGSVDAKDCEFYGYNMGVFLRGDNLEEGSTSHARFVNCLFAKGDQAAGDNTTTSGTTTKHFGALTIGNDNKDSTSYGSIKNLRLENCDFEIVKVTKNTTGTPATPATGDWTPDFEAANGGWDLKGEVASSGCQTGTGEGVTQCTLDTCCHRAIVINIYGCSKYGQPCMNGNDECSEQCKQDTYGKVEIHLDQATLTNLINHAQKFSHTTAVNGTVTNPFLGCTFTDGAELKGKCQKLKIFLIGQTELELNWTLPDGQEMKITQQTP